MEQRKLLRTIETVASGNFESFNDLLCDVVHQLVENEQFEVTGGRAWKLDKSRRVYKLLCQEGSVQRIRKDYTLAIKENPIFDLVTENRTVLADETDALLRKKGIFKYSASGVGAKVKIGSKRYYEYFIAVNSEEVDNDLKYMLNIVATVLTSKRYESSISESRTDLLEEIDSAKEMQKSILPEHEFIFHDYEIFGVAVPAKTLGGDFFDYLPIGDGETRLGITVGDAASKGIAAAAEAMYISGAIRMASNFQVKISSLMYRLNSIVNKIFSDDRFTSLFYGELSNDRKGLFLYANAGHNPPIFISSKNKRLTYLNPTGPLLGPAPHSTYDTDSINFAPGEVCVLYSDGIVDAANDKVQFYGEKRLERLIRKELGKASKEIAY